MAFLLLIITVLLSCGYAIALYGKSYALYNLKDLPARIAYLQRLRLKSRLFLYVLGILTLSTIVVGFAGSDTISVGDGVLFVFVIWWTGSVSVSTSFYIRSLERSFIRQENSKSLGELAESDYHRPKKLWRIFGMLALGLLIVYVLVAIVTSA